MTHSIPTNANFTGRNPRPVSAVAGCACVASFYFGYWFSH